MTTQYQYNPEGIRHSQSDALSATGYLVDSNRSYAQVLAESVDGVTDVVYHFGDDLISQARSSQTHYFHVDGLGSTRVLTDAVGVVSDYAYAAFGEVLYLSGVTVNSYLCAGEQYDSNLDQYYLRARYYDQGVGRFSRMDDWMGRKLDPTTLHKYVYTSLDSVGLIDPSGNVGIASLGFGTSVSVGASVTRLAAFGASAANMIGKVDTAISLYHARSALFRATNQIRTNGFEATIRSNEKFASALANWEDAVSVFGANIGRVFRNVVKGGKIRDFVSGGKGENDMLIYGPTPYPYPPVPEQSGHPE